MGNEDEATKMCRALVAVCAVGYRFILLPACELHVSAEGIQEVTGSCCRQISAGSPVLQEGSDTLDYQSRSLRESIRRVEQCRSSCSRIQS